MEVLGQVLHGLGTLLQAIVHAVQQVVIAVSNIFGLGLDPFTIGLWTGLMLASLVGFVLFWVNDWMDKWGNIYKKQAVMQSTAKTPAQVVNLGCGSMGLLLLGIFVLLVAAFRMGSG